MRTSLPPGQTVTLHDMQMYYVDAGEGEPLLLLHGYTGTSTDWAFCVTNEERTGELHPMTIHRRQACMTENKYQDRDVLDKLGIQPGDTVAFANDVRAIDQDLPQRILERTGRPPARDHEALTIVLV